MLDRIGVIALAGWVSALSLSELRRSFRPRTQTRRERWPTNAALGALASLTERALVVSALVAISRMAARRELGILRWIRLPAPLQNLAALLALDLGSYTWHRMNHQLAFFWRFHAVHHSDLDLDVTTAARLHFGELLLSLPVRSLQLLLIGAEQELLTKQERDCNWGVVLSVWDLVKAARS
jgi:sterol desaturase/sphingolipid hydroxylase (fatty acid hydroxylase superfamily)